VFDRAKDQLMGQVAAQPERDAAMFEAWRDGESQAAIGERYGVTQQAVSLAIGRHLDQLPNQDKAAEIRRTLDLVDGLVGTFIGKARAGDPAASREVRGLLALRGRYLGIDRREVEHTGQVPVEHRLPEPDPIPAVPTAELLEQWSREGRVKIRGQLVRLDQEAGP
jgi:hypothetical protein